MTSQAIQASQGFENPLKPAIRAAFAALTTDYGEKFTKQFRTVSDDGMKPITPDRWQYRLLHLLAGMEDMPSVVVEVVNAIAKRGGGCPTLVELAAECKAHYSSKKRIEQERRDIEFKAELPPPQRTLSHDEIYGMLDQAVKDSKKDNKESWLKRKSDAIKKHEDLITKHSIEGKVRKKQNHAEANCAVSTCKKYGVLSHSTNGSEAWYCREHFRV